MRKPNFPRHGFMWRILVGLILQAVTGTAQTSVKLAWNANPETNVTGYRLLWGTSANSLSQARTVGNVTATEVTGLEPATTYFAAVQALNSSGHESPISTQISFTTLAITEPEIVISDPGGNELPSNTDPLSWGPVAVGASGLPIESGISNSGTGDLTGLTFRITGAHPGDFEVIPAFSSSLVPGGTDSFAVVFRPTAEGIRTATLSITSNDADENPFLIPLHGIGTVASVTPVPGISLSIPGESTLVHGSASCVFGTLDLLASPSVREFTVTSTGNTTLDHLSASVIGGDAADFSVLSTLPPMLGSGDSASLKVSFKPGVVGARTAVLRIVSNDAEHSPFDITLSGTGVAAPEIDMELASGGALADGASGVAFGSPTIGTTGVSKGFVIRSTGSAVLGGLSLSLAGSHPDDFAISAIPMSVAPGESTSFTVTFNPLAAGSRSAILRVASTDADENPFDITLTGTGVAVPEIDMELANGTALADGVSAVAYGSPVIGAAGVSNGFVIRSTGSAGLSGLTASLAGANPGDFAVSTIPSTLAAGGSATFTVTFKPLAAGSRSAILRIASNDADENPYDITLTGTGVAVPEIQMELASGTALTDGVASVALGSSNLGSAGVATSLVIRSTGSADLTGLATVLAGANPGDFTVSPIPASLTPGGSTTFTVTFKPLAAGARSAILRVSSNDADENPYDITLSGTGVAVPEIHVELANGTALADGTSNVAIGSSNLGSSGVTTSLVIRSTGSANLTGLGLSVAGTNPGDFTVSSVPSSLAAGGSTTFSITFKPLAAGSRSAILRIASNDADENPYDIPLSGTGIAVPEIHMELANGTALTDGVASVALGSSNLGSAGVSTSLVIRSTGSANLTGLALSLSGANPGDFTVSPVPALLAPGGSASISVTFGPLAAGSRSAILRVASNDADENPYDITLNGTGVAVPEIAVAGPTGSDLKSGVSAIAFGSQELFSSGGALAFTIRNPGSSNLTGITLSLTGNHASDFAIRTVPASSVPPASSTVFELFFRPGAAGNRSAQLQIASNDADENPFILNLTGNATATPDIGITHADGSTDAVTAGSFRFGAIDLGLETAENQLILHNHGTGPLKQVAVRVSGPHAADFTVAGPITTDVAPGARAPLTIRFNPLAGGLRSAVLTVTSDDPDEGSIEIPLAGTALTYPEISITETKAGILAEGAATLDFGNTPVGNTGSSRVFVIRNTGNGPLTRLRAFVEGGSAREFRILKPLPESIAPGTSAVIRVEFSPLDPGRRGATLRVASNDADEGLFGISLTGGGISVPRIEVRSSGMGDLRDGDSVLTFGAAGRSLRRTITIVNRGTAPLTGISANLAGPHASDFRISGTIAENLSPGRSATFRIDFKPSGKGLRWGALRIDSNDTTAREFDLVLSGRNGATLAKRRSAAKESIVRRDVPPVISTVTVGGERYRCLTVVKSADPTVTISDIEVSGNLVDWKSGHRHLIVVTDNPSILRVRDAIPLGAGIKRHIRLRRDD